MAFDNLTEDFTAKRPRCTLREKLRGWAMRAILFFSCLFLIGPLVGEARAAEEGYLGFFVGDQLRTRFGDQSCSGWTQHRNGDPQHLGLISDMSSAWLRGYITAKARASWAASGVDITVGIYGPDLNFWVDDFCARNPLRHLTEAADALADELQTRAESRRGESVSDDDNQG